MILRMRSHRILSAVLVVMALLFSQWAVAMHACGAMTSASPHATSDARDPCCPEPAAPNTCEQHCAFGHAAVDHGKPAATPDVTLGLALPVPLPRPASFQVHPGRRLLVAPDPPPAIRFSVLRI